MLKVAIDTGPLKSGDSVRGIGVYTREILKAMAIDGVDISKADLSKYDIVHLTRFNPFSVSIPFNKPKGTKFVLNIYDLIPLIYPKHYPPGVKGRLNWEINKFLIRRNVDQIITISETSKKDVCRFIGLNPNEVTVAYLAPRSIFKPITDSQSLKVVQNKYSLPKTFVLYVGDINYNKNIPVLVKACKLADIPLVVSGKQALEVDKMDMNHPELVHLKNIDWSETKRLGFVPDDDLVKIYNIASLYIQPSLYEGFGLPVLEANAAGVPVIASKTQALVEIAENAVVFADPKSVEDFAEKISTVLEDKALQGKLIQKGFDNARKYTWEQTAEITSSIYEKI